MYINELINVLLSINYINYYLFINVNGMILVKCLKKCDVKISSQGHKRILVWIEC